MRNHSLRIRQGAGSTPPRLTPRVKRLNREANRNQRWAVTVTPKGTGDIRIDLGPTVECTATGAMCTEDGRALSNNLPSTTVKGPPGLSVADATAREAEGATVDFAVSLSRRRHSR